MDKSTGPSRLWLPLVALFLVLSPLGANSLRPDPCHSIAFDNCLKRNFFSIGRQLNVSEFVVSQSGFEFICGTFNQTMDCIRGYFARCGSPIHGQLFDLATEEMKFHFRSFICNQSNPDRQDTEFLQRGSCIRKHVFAVDEAIPCLNNYLLAFEHVYKLAEQGSNYSSILNWRQTICCAHQRKRICSHRLALERCDSEAARTFDQFFEQMHFGFFSIVCQTGSAVSPVKEGDNDNNGLPPYLQNPQFNPDSARCNGPDMPDWSQPPKGLQSDSPVSHLLVSYFPFNYVSMSKRKLVDRRYQMINGIGH